MSIPCSNGRNSDRRQHRVVADQRQTTGVGRLRNGAIVEHVVLRIRQRLDVNGPGVGPDGLGDVLRIGGVDKRHVNPQSLESLPEQGNRSAVERGGGNDVAAGVNEIEQGHGDGLLTAAEGQRPDPAVERGHPLLKDVGGRIHQPRVNPAEFFQCEQVGGVFGAPKHVAGRLMDRHRPGPRVRVRYLAGVQCQRSQSSRRLSFGSH